MSSAEKPLDGRRILVCVSASIAAYKSVYLIRSLRKLGAFVSVAMTPSTSRFVGAATFSAVASEAAFDDLWDNRGSIAHTSLGRSADIVVVVPATASIIAKMAHGIADEIVSATLLCTPKQTPIVAIPAMHEEMFDNPSTQENITTLRNRSVEFIGPVSGELAGGDVGRGRLIDSEVIVSRIIEIASGIKPKQKDQESEQGQQSQEPILNSDAIHQPVMLVTAGGTREPIDPVRVITNRSTGKMGHAIAHAGLLNGYRVILITTSDLDSDPGIERIEVETANEMYDAVIRHLDEANVVVMTAAVADVMPANYSATKLKREAGIESIELVPTKDIVAEIVSRKSKDTYVVCFGAETDYVLENAARKFENKNVDMLVANDVSRNDSGFGKDTNKVWVFDKVGADPIELDTAPKQALAFELVELIDERRA